MKKMMFGAVALSMLATPMALPAPALARDHHGPDRNWRGNDHNWNPQGSYHYDRRYKSRRMGRNDSIYRGHDGRYYCRRSDGTTGLVIGALGGGLAGNLLGGGTLGTLLGAGGGALLGRSVDRGNVKCR
ncbi:glycine zipper 2TM domain-containing protein [Sphingomonas oryzagri]